MTDHNSLTEILQKHPLGFKDELGCLQGTKIKLQVNSEEKGKVEEELERLQSAGIVSLVQFSRSAAPIVLVMKRTVQFVVTTASLQRCIESLLQGINGVSVYIDDILVTGCMSIEEHIQNLDSASILEKL